MGNYLPYIVAGLVYTGAVLYAGYKWGSRVAADIAAVKAAGQTIGQAATEAANAIKKG